MKNMRRTLLVVMAAALLLVMTVGGTLAWLTDSTSEIKNTFTTSDVDIELSETKGGENKQFKMVPGCTISKDPTVKVLADSEKCYVFVKVEKSTNFDAFMEYTMAEGWTALTDVNNVYYRVVEDTDADQTFAVIKDNTVTVKSEVTKAQMDALTAETYPTLTITAYACQAMKNNNETFTPAEAWNNVPKQ